MLLKMVAVMFYFRTSLLFYLNGIHVFRGWAVRQAAARLNKRTGCKSPRCRRCKCRGGLPLAKASHWSDLRRQTGRRPRHKSEDLRRQKKSLCPGNRVKWSVCDAEKRPRRCFMVLPRPFFVSPYRPVRPPLRSGIGISCQIAYGQLEGCPA